MKKRKNKAIRIIPAKESKTPYKNRSPIFETYKNTKHNIKVKNPPLPPPPSPLHLYDVPWGKSRAIASLQDNACSYTDRINVVLLYPSRVTGTEDKHPSNFALRRLLGLERLLRDGRAGWLMGPSNEVLRQFIGKTALFGAESLDLW